MKSLTRVALAIAMVGLLFGYLHRTGLLEHLADLDWYWWLLSSVTAWMAMIFSSWTMFLAKIRATPRPRTLAFYPIVQNLAGYIFPVQGSLVFSMFYFRHVYNIEFAKALSFNLVILLFSVSACGLCGLLLLFEGGRAQEGSGLSFLLLSLMLSGPVVVFVFCLFTPIESDVQGKSAYGFVGTSVLQALSALQQQIREFLSSVPIFCTYCGKVIVYFAWFWFLAEALSIDFSLLELIFLVFAVESSLIFKFVPGNWGVAQATGGIALALVGSSVADGVLLITVWMLSVVILIASVGWIAASYIAEDLSGVSVGRMYSVVKSFGRQQGKG